MEDGDTMEIKYRGLDLGNKKEPEEKIEPPKEKHKKASKKKSDKSEAKPVEGIFFEIGLARNLTQLYVVSTCLP